MEQQKIGKFIHDLRKEKELTQKQLADLVGVSINELLSGEKLSVDNYNGKAEENMVNLLKDTEQQKEKQRWSKVNIILNLLWVLLFDFMLFILGFGIEAGYLMFFWDMPSLYLIIGFLILGLGISGQMKDFWYGIKAACTKDAYNIKERVALKKAEYALDFGIKIVILTGILTALVSFVMIMISMGNVSALGPNLSVMTLKILYGIVFSMVLVIFKARVHNKMNE